MEKRIGKIQAARFGMGGYQDACIGLSLTFGSNKDCWGVGTFIGNWATKHDQYCKWTEEDRLRSLGEACMKLAAMLSQIHGESVDDLIGKPVEVTFTDSTLTDWRLLEEAL